MGNFQDILKTKAAVVEPPKALPVGPYLMIVDGQPELGERGKNNNGAAIFSMKPLQAYPGVDQQQLLDILKGAQLADKRIKHTLWITDDALWRLDKFLSEDLGIEKGSKEVGEMIPESPGREVVVVLGHRASDDGKMIYNEVKSTHNVKTFQG